MSEDAYVQLRDKFIREIKEKKGYNSGEGSVSAPYLVRLQEDNSSS